MAEHGNQPKYPYHHQQPPPGHGQGKSTVIRDENGSGGSAKEQEINGTGKHGPGDYELPPQDQVPPGDGQDDEDKGKDLWPLVPQLEVPEPWNSVTHGSPGSASFNHNPPSSDGQKASSSSDVPTVSPVKVNLSTVRESLASMLDTTKSMVAEYETMRDRVLSSKDSVFGQHSFMVIRDENGSGGSAKEQELNGTAKHGPGDYDVDSPITESANEYAAHINPAQERALEQIANAIEIVGHFIAGTNSAGQAYGMADRKSGFPAPPAFSPVVDG